MGNDQSKKPKDCNGATSPPGDEQEAQEHTELGVALPDDRLNNNRRVVAGASRKNAPIRSRTTDLLLAALAKQRLAEAARGQRRGQAAVGLPQQSSGHRSVEDSDSENSNDLTGAEEDAMVQLPALLGRMGAQVAAQDAAPQNSQQQPAPPTFVPKPWSCDSCTYRNGRMDVECHMCLMPNPDAAQLHKYQTAQLYTYQIAQRPPMAPKTIESAGEFLERYWGSVDLGLRYQFPKVLVDIILAYCHENATIHLRVMDVTGKFKSVQVYWNSTVRDLIAEIKLIFGVNKTIVRRATNGLAGSGTVLREGMTVADYALHSGDTLRIDQEYHRQAE